MVKDNNIIMSITTHQLFFLSRKGTKMDSQKTSSYVTFANMVLPVPGGPYINKFL